MHLFQLLFFYLFIAITVLTVSGELKFRGVKGDRNINEFKFYCLGHAPSLDDTFTQKRSAVIGRLPLHLDLGVSPVAPSLL